MVEDSITKGDYVSNDVDITGDNKRISIIKKKQVKTKKIAYVNRFLSY